MRKTLIGVVGLMVLIGLVCYFLNVLQLRQDKALGGNRAMDQKSKASEHHFSVDVLEFFHVNDALEVTWAHAVNSRSKLQEALAGKVMMIEADVLLRAGDGTPIMAHPPNTDSDLSLAEFLKETIGSYKGIKLDFKSTAVVEPSLKILMEKTPHQQASIPILLNADILPGPCQSDSYRSPVDPHIFLSLCTKYFSSAILSVGWTTKPYVSVLEDYYEWRFVEPMRALLTAVSQPVTFPVRANMIGRSMEQMLWLLSLSDDYTLTIWSATHDELNIKDLVALRNKVANKARIFFDLPSDQKTKFLEELNLQISSNL